MLFYSPSLNPLTKTNENSNRVLSHPVQEHLQGFLASTTPRQGQALWAQSDIRLPGLDSHDEDRGLVKELRAL